MSWTTLQICQYLSQDIPYHLQNPLTLLLHQRQLLNQQHPDQLHSLAEKSVHYSINDIMPGAQRTYHLNALHEHAMKAH